ncbi:MAG: hypothetical protein ACLR6J_05370 [Parabacteroides merdae]
MSEDESTEENRQQNRAIKKSMTQTIMRLREDLTTFPELSIENASGLSYRLNIGTVRESNIGLEDTRSGVTRIITGAFFKIWHIPATFRTTASKFSRVVIYI